MDEFQFINSITQKNYRQKSLLKGIGDDAAVFRNSFEDIVTAVDTFVENVHFSKKTMTSFQVGYRILAANISDMAAMGASPKFYLVSIVVPSNMKEQTLIDIFSGMKSLAREYHMDLIGGDTVSGNHLTISITIIGYVPKGKARYRKDAKEKDIVFVTGSLGNSRAGLHILMNDVNVTNKKYFIQKHQMPQPRVHFTNSLVTLNRVALNDISDGIANELREIAEASNVTIIVEDEKVPVSDDFIQFTKEQQYEWKYFGGEDFEIVGTIPRKDWDFVKQKAKEHSLRLTKIGYVTYNEQLGSQVFIKKANHLHPLEKLGYIHLK